MCERKCNCNLKSCPYCKERTRYEREIPIRLHRAKIRALHEKYRLEASYVLLDDFISKRISLQEFEVDLNVR
jgi:glutaredoxin